mmetsp:Transcript_82399/g.266873  ORF Transcript_82399/g.266873 Transcript_82399/m.266873 type:complete len:103 (+) Transcript_82399:51-359(+)
MYYDRRDAEEAISFINCICIHGRFPLRAQNLREDASERFEYMENTIRTHYVTAAVVVQSFIRGYQCRRNVVEVARWLKRKKERAYKRRKQAEKRKRNSRAKS